jgi:hypothetical protein
MLEMKLTNVTYVVGKMISVDSLMYSTREWSTGVTYVSVTQPYQKRPLGALACVREIKGALHLGYL